MSLLTQTRVVLIRPLVQKSDKWVNFWSYSQDEVDRGILEHHVYIPPATWDELGRPEEITITIEAGDLLNEASDG